MKNSIFWYKNLKRGMKFQIKYGKKKINYSYIKTYKGKYVFAIRCENHKIYEIINVKKMKEGITVQ